MPRSASIVPPSRPLPIQSNQSPRQGPRKRQSRQDSSCRQTISPSPFLEDKDPPLFIRQRNAGRPDIERINGKGEFIRVSPENQRMPSENGRFSLFLFICFYSSRNYWFGSSKASFNRKSYSPICRIPNSSTHGLMVVFETMIR